MLPLEVIFRILDDLREEAIQAAEAPSSDDRTEYGFGRVSGILQVLRETRNRIENVVEESNKDEEEEK